MIQRLSDFGVLVAVAVLFPVIWAVTTRSDPVAETDEDALAHQ